MLTWPHPGSLPNRLTCPLSLTRKKIKNKKQKKYTTSLKFQLIQERKGTLLQ